MQNKTGVDLAEEDEEEEEGKEVNGSGSRLRKWILSLP